jgi:large subunit ribosomal protein L10
MDRAAKEQLVSELKELIIGKSSVVLTDYKGMSVAEMFELRREFDKVGVGYRVVKNTLAKLALAGTDYEFLGAGLQGTVAVAYSEDPVAPAKVLADFAKKSKHLTVKLGFLDGKELRPEDLDALSKLPGKDQLRAKLLSVFNAPATKLVGVLAAGPRDFIGVLQARRAALGD